MTAIRESGDAVRKVWREKRGELGPKGVSDDPVVRLGTNGGRTVPALRGGRMADARLS